MEDHLSRDTWIEEPCKNISSVIRDANHIYLLVFDIPIEVAQNIIVGNHAVLQIHGRILLLKVIFDASQFDFVPCVVIRTQMDERKIGRAHV